MQIEDLIKKQEFSITEKSILSQISILNYFEGNVLSRFKKFVKPFSGEPKKGSREYTTTYFRTVLIGITSRIHSLIYLPTKRDQYGNIYLGAEKDRLESLAQTKKDIKKYSNTIRRLGVSPTIQKTIYKELQKYHKWSITVGKNEAKKNWYFLLENGLEKNKAEQKENVNIRTSSVGSGEEYRPINKQAALEMSH